MELTKEYLDKALTGLATKKDLYSLATSEELKVITSKIDAVQETVNSHTTALSALATDVKKVLDEKTVSAHRFDRLEHWAQQVGEKIGIKLEL